nr:P2X purinoceptor 3a [Misgurnus anguillicaudatus]
MVPRIMDCIADFFVYETTKSVVVKSWSVGTINRVVQLLIILYFVCWVFLHEKAYQNRDTAIESAVMTKVKGLGTLNNHVMDVADYVSPPQGSSAFSIITKLIITDNQMQGLCPEIDEKFSCETDVDCDNRKDAHLANGILTGRCLNNYSSSMKTSGQCEIQGWCPAENDKSEENPMNVDNFTIFIKNSIRFPLFNVTRGNFPSSMNIASCLYDPVDNPSCPIFKVGDILKIINQANIIKTGGEIGINIAWKCNLDYSEENCNPQYSFTRLDAVFQNSGASKGYNFRFAKYYKSENGTEHRTLHKAYGISFEIIVSGDAGKFGIVPFMINLVTLVTSVGLATVFCDVILLHFHHGADEYKAKKFEKVSNIVSHSCDDQLYKSSQISIKAM